jgi:indolepyruvate ferredoxin oxidoreductase
MILLGFAWQRGWAPLSRASLEQAIRMNGASVAANLQAFALGRRVAVDPAAAGPPKAAPKGLEDTVAALAADLRDYQDAQYAARFETAIAEVSRAEQTAYPGSTQLALAAAQSLHKLMAYKDEYEVARLFVGPEFKAQLKSVRGDGGRVFLHLAPPFIAPRDPTIGHPKKLRFGGWVLALMPALKRLRVLRGTPLDPFGRTEERRLERDLRDEYLALLPLVTAKIGARPLDELLALLSLPQGVRGFGHVKDAAVASYRTELELARAKLFESPVLTPRRVIARTPAEART